MSELINPNNIIIFLHTNDINFLLDRIKKRGRKME